MMRLARLVLLVLACLTASGQKTQPVTLTGVIEQINGNTIQIKSGKQLVTLEADEKTEVSVGRSVVAFHSLAALKAGLEIAAHCDEGAGGKKAAVSIWTEPEIVTLRAVVITVNPNDGPAKGSFEVLTYPEASAALENPSANRVIFFSRHTLFGGRKSVIEGEDVGVVGLELENGRVQALRITIYNTDGPGLRSMGPIR